MASCSAAIWSSGFLVPRKNLFAGSGRFKSSTRPCGFFNSLDVCNSSWFSHSLGLQECCTGRNYCFSFKKGRNGSLLLGVQICWGAEDKESRPLMCGTSGDKITHLDKIETNNSRKKFLLRLWPRLKFVARKMKRLHARSMLKHVVPFLRKNVRNVMFSAAISFALGMCYLFLKLTALPSPKIVPYSEFITSLQNGSVTKVLLEEDSRRIYYNMLSQGDENVKMLATKSPEIEDENSNFGDMAVRHDVNFGQALKVDMLRKLITPKHSAPAWHYSTRKIDRDEKFLLKLMREKGITYTSAPQSVWVSIRSALLMIISLWIHLTPLMWLLYRQLSPPKSQARKQLPDNEAVGFDDVEGVDAAKTELMEVVSCLQGSISYNKLGAKLPRGILLVGPPGTGKTLLARAVAGEAGVPFFSVSASEFVELYVGRGAARIRDLFKNARKSAPSIIFIDELDGVGGKRGRSFNDERDQTLNQLLTEMDGFESEMKVIVIAATNRPGALDPALCRAGRFSRKVHVGEPNEEGRRNILAVHLRGVPLEEDRDLISDLVASLTQGFVGADLANIVNEAALLAARRGGETVTREDIMEAIERAKFGISEQRLRPSSISKELVKLFPWSWMPSLTGRTNWGQDGLSGPFGYQTLS